METMLKLTQLKVLLVGVNGVGAEAAKNITLAGAKHITLFDPKPVQVCINVVL